MIKFLLVAWVLATTPDGTVVLTNDSYIAGPNGDRGGIQDQNIGQSAADRAARAVDDRGGIRDQNLGWSAAKRALDAKK